jgi:Domain of unknown function (DUF4870)
MWLTISNDIEPVNQGRHRGGKEEQQREDGRDQRLLHQLRHFHRHLRPGGPGRGPDAGRHPLLIAGVIAWVVLASLAAVKASQGQAYRYPLTMRLVR